MSYLSGISFYFMVFVACAYALNKNQFPGFSWLLHGLTWYELIPLGVGQTESTAKPIGPDAGRRKAKQAGKRRKAALMLGSVAEAPGREMDLNRPLSRPIGVNDLMQFEHHDEFHLLLGLVVIVVVQLAISELFTRCFDRSPSPLLILAAYLAAFFVVRFLVGMSATSVTLSGRPSALERQALQGTSASLAVVLSLALLLLPGDLLDVDLRGGAAGAQDAARFWAMHWAAAREILGQRAAGGSGAAGTFAAEPAAESHDRPVFQASVSGPSSGLVLAFTFLVGALGGAYGGLAMLPLVRFGRCVQGVLHMPPWLLAGLGGGGMSSVPLVQPLQGRISAVLAVLCPAASLLLWIRPIAEDVWGLDRQQRAAAQGIALIVCGALSLLPLRPIMQAYLNTGLQRWYRIRHSTSGKASNSRDAARLAHTYMNNTCALVSRVALQVTIPAAALIVLGCVLSNSVGLGRPVVELEDEDIFVKGVLLDFVMPPPQLMVALCGALGFVALLAQTVYVLSTLALYRIGVLAY